MSQTTGKRKMLEEKIISKAMEDSGFRQALVSDPRGTLQKEMKLSVPAEIDIEVLEEKPNKVYLVLPFNSQNMELSDDALKGVAGAGGGGVAGGSGGGCGVGGIYIPEMGSGFFDD